MVAAGLVAWPTLGAAQSTGRQRRTSDTGYLYTIRTPGGDSQQHDFDLYFNQGATAFVLIVFDSDNDVACRHRVACKPTIASFMGVSTSHWKVYKTKAWTLKRWPIALVGCRGASAPVTKTDHAYCTASCRNARSRRRTSARVGSDFERWTVITTFVAVAEVADVPAEGGDLAANGEHHGTAGRRSSGSAPMRSSTRKAASKPASPRGCRPSCGVARRDGRRRRDAVRPAAAVRAGQQFGRCQPVAGPPQASPAPRVPEGLFGQIHAIPLRRCTGGDIWLGTDRKLNADAMTAVQAVSGRDVQGHPREAAAEA